MRLKLESWIEAYDRTLGGKGVSAFVLRPSCLRYRRMCIRLWHLVCCKGLGDCNS